MGRGKNKNRKFKGTKNVKIKKKKVPTPDALNPLQEKDIPPALRPLVNGIKESTEKRVRYSELKSLHQFQKLSEMVEEIKANQVVIQTLLMENNIINRESFKKEYKKYFNEVVGIVNNGKMSGTILVDTFNIGAERKENSLRDIKTGKNPIIVNRS